MHHPDDYSGDEEDFLPDLVVFRRPSYHEDIVENQQPTFEIACDVLDEIA